MGFLRNVLQIYSWIYETILSLMAIAVAAAVVISGDQTLRIGWLPWTGGRLLAIMLAFGFAGLISVFLAMTGKLRILLLFFSVYALYLLVSGLFFNQGYAFHGPTEAQNAVFLAVGAALALVGAWPLAPPRRR